MALAENVAGTDGVNSIGHLRCAAKEGANLSDCIYEMLPKDGGEFTLRIALPGGAVRYLYGKNGKITGTDSTSSMGSKRFANKTVVHIQPGELIEIPNSLIDPK
ncbi:hypothetical protein [Pseudophaeobacter sp.]|uniref:hypothetical protein n=1 Tax=Pseudophaeobacter sp. TaxID=1971739 RepID=UPI00329A1162